ncbi:unnamed protein product, partial [Mesorhabditis spiculigera]
MGRKERVPRRSQPKSPLPFLSFRYELQQAVYGHLGFWEKHRLRATTKQLACNVSGIADNPYWPVSKYVDDILISVKPAFLQILCETRCGELQIRWMDFGVQAYIEFYHDTYRTWNRDIGPNRDHGRRELRYADRSARRL